MVNVDIRRAIPATMRIGRWAAPDGWPLRDFDWPVERDRPRGSLLFLGGRGDFIEKYLEALHHWHDHGWALAGFDWRGQTGSGRLPPGATIDFDALVDDLVAYISAWRMRTPLPHVVVGHSMGGHLVLRALVDHPREVDAAILVAPMLGYQYSPIPPWLARGVVRAANAIGLGARPAWPAGERPELIDARRRLNLTHCPDRFADEGWWKAQVSDYVTGPPTWAWLAAGSRSMAMLENPGVLEAAGTPILLMMTPRDRLVSAAAIRRAAARLPDARLEIYPGGAHELLRESDPVRLAVFAAIDAFLDDRAPAR